MDRDGIGGVLSDVFGVNGQLILRGMEEPREEIVPYPPCRRKTRHAKPSPTISTRTVGKSWATCCHDYASQKIARYDKLIREGLDDFKKQLLLLQTIPGQGVGLRPRP